MRTPLFALFTFLLIVFAGCSASEVSSNDDATPGLEDSDEEVSYAPENAVEDLDYLGEENTEDEGDVFADTNPFESTNPFE